MKVVAWLKSEGEKVEMGEAVLVVESDKADMDVESYDEGYLAAIITGDIYIYIYICMYIIYNIYQVYNIFFWLLSRSCGVDIGG